MNEIKVIDRGLSVGIYYNGQPVCTTEQLAEAYGADRKKLSYNFNQNKARYQEGKHYICLQGEEKTEFVNRLENHDSLKNAKQIYLWTERGALLHAKSLNTDKAWEVYERLVDFYFNVKENGVPAANNASKEELPSLDRHAQAAVRAIGSLLQQGYTTAPYVHNSKPVEPFLGFDSDTHVYIRATLLHDAYRQIVPESLSLSGFYQILADAGLIDRGEQRWISEKKNGSRYIYIRHAGKKTYRLLRFKKAAVLPYLLAEINVGNISELQ